MKIFVEKGFCSIIKFRTLRFRMPGMRIIWDSLSLSDWMFWSFASYLFKVLGFAYNLCFIYVETIQYYFDKVQTNFHFNRF